MEVLTLWVKLFVFLVVATEVQYVNLTTGAYIWSTDIPYLAQNQTVVVEAEEGYLIHVKITECDISGEDGDFMLIKAGILHF